MNQQRSRINRQNEREMTAAEAEMKPFDDLIRYVRVYAQERPEMFALTCFGIGFILGWRLKPW